MNNLDQKLQELNVLAERAKRLSPLVSLDKSPARVYSMDEMEDLMTWQKKEIEFQNRS